MTAQYYYKKWIEGPTEILKAGGIENLKPSLASRYRESPKLFLDGKVAQSIESNVKGRGDAIQDILKRANIYEQLERDVAMWYGYCSGSGKGAQLLLRIFNCLKTYGVIYKDGSGTWGDVGETWGDFPVASLLSHGSRILILLPCSNSRSRVWANHLKTFMKGLTVDPITAFGNRGVYHTLRLKSTTGAVAGHAVLRATGLASLASILTTGHKSYAAGDDRFWSWLNSGTVHDRVAATHSTIRVKPLAAEPLIKNRHLWFTEEKASGSHILSNLRDAAMGRHHYKNIALGGRGNINPFSGVEISKDGSHGHLYLNYRAPSVGGFGCILLGCEGSAPGKANQYGKSHDANATKGEWSATGGRKWDKMYPGSFFKSDDKSDVTTFVCDLSAGHTSGVIGNLQGNPMQASQLHETVNPVPHANWDEVVRRRPGLDSALG